MGERRFETTRGVYQYRSVRRETGEERCVKESEVYSLS